MSVEELRARLQKLSTEIDLQKEVLKKLEHDKSLVQRRLNAALDPLARLPLELSSEIFVCCLPSRPEPGPHCAPVLLLNICHAWTDIALSIPALWAAIQITLPYAPGFVPPWLQRAGSHPLSLFLRGKFSKGVANIIYRHSQRLKHLEICETEEEDDEDKEWAIDLFGEMGPAGLGPLPSLTTLMIRGLVYPSHAFHGSRLLQLLRLAPNLVDCIFHNLQPVYDVVATAEKLVIPTLRRLMFGDCGMKPESDDDILRCLSLPALESLSLSLRDVTGADLIAFLKRSLPPLRELVAGDSMSFVQLDECLRLVPTLARFEVWWLEATQDLEDLFSALAESPSLLPNLRTLAIHISFSVIPDSYLRILLTALTVRRTRVMDVKLLYRRRPLNPAEDILAAFRELAIDGMHIYIGTEGAQNNLIFV